MKAQMEELTIEQKVKKAFDEIGDQISEGTRDLLNTIPKLHRKVEELERRLEDDFEPDREAEQETVAEIGYRGAGRGFTLVNADADVFEPRDSEAEADPDIPESGEDVEDAEEED